MKRIFKSIISFSLSVILVSGLVGCSGQPKETMAVNETKAAEDAAATNEPTEIVLWYTNEELSNYVDAAAKEYSASNNIIINPKLVSEIDYIENINQAVLANEAAPDLFIAENSDLEKVYLAGLTKENQDTTYLEENYYKTALSAFTYKDKLLAYPLYFETSYLLYNQQYVTTPPSTIDDILNFANEFDAPEGVEAIFNWDVTDILCNYFFIGNYLNNEEINNEKYIVDKEKLIKALSYYQSLNQYFAIDADTVDYETAFQNFVEGKSVFTIAKTDKLSEIEMMEGDASDEVQEVDQNASINADNTTVKEESNETNEAQTTTEEQTQNADSNNEATSQNNQTDVEGATEQSGQTTQADSDLINNSKAGVEKIWKQKSSTEQEATMQKSDAASSNESDASNEESQNQALNVQVGQESEQPKTDIQQTSAADTVTTNPGTIIDKNSNFKIIPLPNLTSDLEGKGLAVSYGVFVNGYTSKQDEASKFAKYLTYNKAAELYQQSGKLSAKKGIDYKNDNIANVLKEYEKDVTVPKVMENRDFWLQLEIAFSNIWKGADVNQTIDKLSTLEATK
jgi:maltose-binding protein MalE